MRSLFASSSALCALVAVALTFVVGCTAGGGATRRPRDSGMTIDAGVPDPECGEGIGGCPVGQVCAAVMGVPRCVFPPPTTTPPTDVPPGDGTDCSPCPAPGECRSGVCVQPSPSGGVCEFDAECGPSAVCIAGRCTPDPRVPVPCTTTDMCAAPLTCVEGLCRCVSTTDCPIGLVCASSGLCTPGPGGDGCVADDECPDGMLCEVGRCRARTVCDIESPDLSGTWAMQTTLRVREALPEWLSDFLDAVDAPFRYLGGETTCTAVDFGLPSWAMSALCDLVEPYVNDYLPPWAPPVFRAIADLNTVLSTWFIDETMTLERGAVRDSYRGSHRWTRVRFMYRSMPIEADVDDIVDWRFDPGRFNAAATCGTFSIERHDVGLSIGRLVMWIVDTVVYEVSDGRWVGVEDALASIADGFCMGLAEAAEDAIDYPGVGGTVMRVCSSATSRFIREAINELLEARLGFAFMTLRGTSPIAGPNSLRPGVWDGRLLGSEFGGEFQASR
jgi:hypothetical protein